MSVRVRPVSSRRSGLGDIEARAIGTEGGWRYQGLAVTADHGDGVATSARDRYLPAIFDGGCLAEGDGPEAPQRQQPPASGGGRNLCGLGETDSGRQR